jgi:hypothetical protein
MYASAWPGAAMYRSTSAAISTGASGVFSIM